MSELRVPTLSLPVVVSTADGRSLAGQVFVPAAASHHSGPMRPEEWINEPVPFFPFLPEGSAGPMLLNKGQVAVLTVATGAEKQDAMEAAQSIERRVIVECGARRLEGLLRIEMPAHHSRVQDHLNRSEPFLVLREGDRYHLIHKRHITKVLEVLEP